MKLEAWLERFAGNKKPQDAHVTSLSEIRTVFKPQEELKNVTSLMYAIFNSLWNRLPNFNVFKVFVEKFNYTLRIGTGISSYNQLPISWIVDSAYDVKNFLMKDRGHITTLICWNYTKKFQLTVVLKLVKDMLSEYKTMGWKDDYNLKMAVPILEDIFKYLKDVQKSELTKTDPDGKKYSKSDIKISISNICDNVPAFNQRLNHTPITVEARKESIFVHAAEILGLNCDFNNWIGYQRAFLSACTSFMRVDGNDFYLRSVLKLEALRFHIDTLKCFKGQTTLFSNAISTYKSKLENWGEIIPLKLLAVRLKAPSYEDRGTLYYSSKEEHITSLLECFHKNSYKYGDAVKVLNLIDKITVVDKWDEFDELKVDLEKVQLDHLDVKNLKDSRIKSEDFGMACVDSVMELLDCVPGMKGRSPKELVETVVIRFVDELKSQLESVVSDESLFGASKDMGARFSHIILPAFDRAKAIIVADKAESKDALWDVELNTIKHLFNGVFRFKITKIKNETYKGVETEWINFSGPRGEGGLDLGQKLQGQGYKTGQVFIQIASHNRQNDGNHIVSTPEYWAWFAEWNYRNVMNNKDRFAEMRDYQTLGDADALLERFTTKEIQEKLKLEFEETVIA